MAPDDDQNTGKQMSIVAYDMLVTCRNIQINSSCVYL